VAQYLLEELHMNVNDTNKNGMTPLHRACHQENLDIIRLLCNHGADLYAKDYSGRTPKDISKPIVRRFIQVEPLITDLRMSANDFFCYLGTHRCASGFIRDQASGVGGKGIPFTP
jgi:hypothetical protein